jgi:hypothetical protein
MVSVKKVSLFTGNINRMELPCTDVQLLAGLARMESGELVQDVFPDFTADQREFLITGATPEEWDAAFNDTEE